MPVSVSSHHLNFRYEEKDYMQNKTRATALGSLQLIDMKGCVGKSEPLNLIRFLLSHFNVNLKLKLFQIRANPWYLKRVQATAVLPISFFVTPFFHRKFGMELKGPDKSYFLWALTKDAIDVLRSLIFMSPPFCHTVGRISTAGSSQSLVSNSEAFAQARKHSNYFKNYQYLYSI
jgi:hypothetical protein